MRKAIKRVVPLSNSRYTIANGQWASQQPTDIMQQATHSTQYKQPISQKTAWLNTSPLSKMFSAVSFLRSAS
jgi:hypothetical protein